MTSPLHRLAAAIAAVSLSLFLVACGGDPAGQGPQDMSTPEVTVVRLEARPLTLTRELPGRTHPYLVAEVRPQVSGIIAKQLFVEGSRVKSGEALYQLDDATYRADVTSARAALARAQALAESARLSAERIGKLAEIEAVSAQENENAIAARRQAEAEVAVARAALDNASIRLGYARISSPIDGRIGKSSVTQGALVTANQQAALATVQTLDPIHVDLTQSSSELLELRRSLAEGRLSRGDEAMPVTILLEDGSEFPQQGTLKFSEVTVDPSTGSYALRVEVPNPDHVLMPGMYVRAVLGAGVRNDAVLVPQRGIARDPKGNTTAMVVGADGVVEQREVVVSRTIGDQWLVESGLADGDRVVIEGLQKIQPGAQVNATEVTNTATGRE